MKYLILFTCSFVFIQKTYAEPLVSTELTAAGSNVAVESTAVVDYSQPVENKEWQILQEQSNCLATTSAVSVNGAWVESGIEMKVVTPIIYDWMVNEEDSVVQTKRVPYALLSIRRDSLTEAMADKLFVDPVKRSRPYYWQLNQVRVEDGGAEVLEYYLDFRYIYNSEQFYNQWSNGQRRSLGEILINDNYFDFNINQVSFRISLSGSGKAYKDSVESCAKREVNEDSTNVTSLDKELIGKIIGKVYFYNYGVPHQDWQDWTVSPIEALVQFGEQSDLVPQKEKRKEALSKEKHEATRWRGTQWNTREKASSTKSAFESKAQEIEGLKGSITSEEARILETDAALTKARSELTTLEGDYQSKESAFAPAKAQVDPIDQRLRAQKSQLRDIVRALSVDVDRKEDIDDRLEQIPEDREQFQATLDQALSDLEQAQREKESKESARADLLGNESSIKFGIERSAYIDFSELDEKRKEHLSVLTAAEDKLQKMVELYNLASFVVETTKSLATLQESIENVSLTGRTREELSDLRAKRAEERRLIALLGEAQIKMAVDFVAYTFSYIKNYRTCGIATRDDFCTYEAERLLSESDDEKDNAEGDWEEAQSELDEFIAKEQRMYTEFNESYTKPLAVLNEEIAELRLKVSELREIVTFNRSGLISLPSEQVALQQELGLLVPKITQQNQEKTDQELAIEPIHRDYGATVASTNYKALKTAFDNADIALRSAQEAIAESPVRLERYRASLSGYQNELSEAEALIGALEAASNDAAAEFDRINARVELIEAELKQIDEFLSTVSSDETKLISYWRDYLSYIED